MLLRLHPRRRRRQKRFSDILLEGLAPDGGLYVPESFPAGGPRGLAQAVLSRTSRSRSCRTSWTTCRTWSAIVEATYTKEIFGSDDITPLKTLEPGLHLLGLSNGPTLAFKDVALAASWRICSKTCSARKQTDLNILGATSGDTGSAAEYAHARQEEHPRVHALAARAHERLPARADVLAAGRRTSTTSRSKGVFDDCQDVVKQVNADAAFKAQHRIGAVNSINWARIAAQVVYYFKGYFAATQPTPSRSRSPCRRATSATSTPATSRARWACRCAS